MGRTKRTRYCRINQILREHSDGKLPPKVLGRPISLQTLRQKGACLNYGIAALLKVKLQKAGISLKDPSALHANGNLDAKPQKPIVEAVFAKRFKEDICHESSRANGQVFLNIRVVGLLFTSGAGSD